MKSHICHIPKSVESKRMIFASTYAYLQFDDLFEARILYFHLQNSRQPFHMVWIRPFANKKHAWWSHGKKGPPVSETKSAMSIRLGVLLPIRKQHAKELCCALQLLGCSKHCIMQCFTCKSSFRVLRTICKRSHYGFYVVRMRSCSQMFSKISHGQSGATMTKTSLRQSWWAHDETSCQHHPKLRTRVLCASSLHSSFPSKYELSSFSPLSLPHTLFTLARPNTQIPEWCGAGFLLFYS
jgi:hypothetical protein